MGSLKQIILGEALAEPNMIFFSRIPIYFRITPLSVYITNINLYYSYTLPIQFWSVWMVWLNDKILNDFSVCNPTQITVNQRFFIYEWKSKKQKGKGGKCILSMGRPIQAWLLCPQTSGPFHKNSYDFS